MAAAASAFACFVVLLAACSGKSDAPPATNESLPCLATLDSYCCNDASPVKCFGDYASAERCGNWPTGATVLVYPSACGDYDAVSVRLLNDTFASFYLYDSSSGKLMAVGDDAQDNAQGAVEIECGAGPTTFTLPSTCGVEWLDPTQSKACASGTSTPTSVCQ